MIECPSCGKENREIAIFCQYCGGALAITAPPEQEAEEVSVLLPGDLHSSTLVEGEEGLSSDAASGESALGEAEMMTEEETAQGEEEGPVPVEPVGTLEALGVALAEISEQVTRAQMPVEGEPLPEEAEAELENLGLEQGEERAADRLEASPDGQRFVDDGLDAVAEVVQPGDGGATDILAPEEQIPLAEVSQDVEASEQGRSDDGIAVETPAEPERQEKPETVLPERGENESYYGDQETDDVQDLARDGLLPWRESPEPIDALMPGTVVGGRYLISEVLSDEEDQVLYRIRDLKRCRQCGSTENNPDEAFCVSCGAALDQKPVALMLERSTDQGDQVVGVRLDDQFAEGERFYWVWRDAPETTEPEGVQRSKRMLIGQKSHTGQVRELDEDSLFALVLSRTHESVEERLALFIVADGMGGHEGGEIASRLAIQTFAGDVMRNVFTPELEGLSFSCEDICAWMVQAMEEANDRVYLARQKHQNDMGTTMTAALIKGWTLCLAHVGDCRAYRWGEKGLEQLTTDHSIVASMIAAGTAEPKEIYTHPQRSMIYRCIGDVPSIEVETSRYTLSPDDRLILCCDGLWEMIRDEGIEESMLREADPQAACDIMVDQANIAGGTDNISVIVVQL